MGVRLQCSTLPTPAVSSSVVAVVKSSVTSNITRVGGGSVLGYGWSNVQSCPRSAFLSGARLLSEFFILETTETLPAGVPTPPGCPTGAICRPPSVANSDPAGGLNVDFRCNDGSTLPGPGIQEQADISSWGVERVCPLGSALCGVRTKIFEGQTDSVSNLGLTDLMLQCCHLSSHRHHPWLLRTELPHLLHPRTELLHLLHLLHLQIELLLLHLTSSSNLPRGEPVWDQSSLVDDEE